MRKELLEGLSEEQIAKIKECNNDQEILEIAKEEGIELNEEQLEAVSGGSSCFSAGNPSCPNCNFNGPQVYVKNGHGKDQDVFCRQCGTYIKTV